MDSIRILSDIVTYGKYARYVDMLNRRENWKEICNRNMGMHIKKFPSLEDRIRDVYNEYVVPKKIFPSMRSLQFAGPAIEQSPSRLFNCSYLPVDDVAAFSEVMFLLLGGSGVGVSVQRAHVGKLPCITKPSVKHRRFLIGDSIEGWADAIKVLMESYFYDKLAIDFDYSDIRPKGAYLVTAGGKAPGPQPLMDAVHNIRKVLDARLDDGDFISLSSLDVFSIMCHISDAVMAGGIRRSAIITVFDAFDTEMLQAKAGNWWETNPHFGRSNNSAVIYRDDEDADAEGTFRRVWKATELSGAGEPGLVFSNDIRYSVNPCVEISLLEFSFCNLTEVVVDGVVSQADLNHRVRAAAFLGTLQASYTDFHYLRPIWKENTDEEALIGVGMTGIGSGDVLPFNLGEAAGIVIDENKRIAEMIGINEAHRTTCVNGTLTK